MTGLATPRPAPAPAPVRLTLIWLIPLLAVLAGLWLGWRHYSARGDVIEIHFPDASGIRAGKTELRFRDVPVGQVEEVRFAEDLGHVRVIARIAPEVAPFVDDKARFWLVRPRLSVREVSGLDTVLAGVHIAGDWDAVAGAPMRRFDGLPTPPGGITETGTFVTLRAPSANRLAEGAPVLHKGINVGHIEAPHLTETGDAVELRAFIRAPHDKRLTSTSRFWTSAGFSVSLGTGGVVLNVESLAALMEGGVVFDTPRAGGAPIREGMRFDLHDSPSAADVPAFVDAVLRLDAQSGVESGSLDVGTEVRFQDQIIGMISALPATGITAQPVAMLRLDPVGLGTDADLAALIESGLRARLVPAGLLGQSTQVELFMEPDAKPAPNWNSPLSAPLIPWAIAPRTAP